MTQFLRGLFAKTIIKAPFQGFFKESAKKLLLRINCLKISSGADSFPLHTLLELLDRKGLNRSLQSILLHLINSSMLDTFLNKVAFEFIIHFLVLEECSFSEFT
jgi:hypothetical protein